MDEAAPAVGSAVEKKRGILRRVPTSLWVTLLGIVLTAWLVPAFTRQWDDRQEAQALKAGLVSEMATATAGALAEDHDILMRSFSRDAAPSKVGVPQALRGADLLPTPESERDWARSSIRIEAQLRANLGDREAKAWHAYRHIVDRVLAYSAGLPFGPQADPFPTPLPGDARLNADVEDYSIQRSAAVAHIRDEAQRSGAGAELRRLAMELAILNDRLLRDEETIGQQVLAAHVNGYSTTTHDLLHDLIP